MEEQQYVVIANVAEPRDGKYFACRVIEEGSIFLGTHRKVHGPNSEANCVKWVKDNCAGDTPGTVEK